MSAMGLFSIVTLTLANRIKEIGIRKLLGASERSIVLLVANHFLRPIIWSYAVAIPFAFILSRNWLADFAYKTEISWTIFALTGFILIVVTVLTLTYQSLKASRVNPIDNLKHE